MIPVPSGLRVWLAAGHTDMRRGMNSLALQVQEALKRDPHGGDLHVFRGKRGDLIKILWHDGIGMSLYAKRLERGRFIWPAPPADGVVAIAASQLALLGIGNDGRVLTKADRRLIESLPTSGLRHGWVLKLWVERGPFHGNVFMA
jgi:transposase